MSQSVIFLASAFSDIDHQIDGARLIPSQDREAAVHYGHLPPNPDQLGGAFSFSTADGRAVTEKDFQNRWNLLYFGYARCTDSCPAAIPSIVRAAAMLRAADVDARAVFVDIEASAIGTLRRRAAADESHSLHPHEMDRKAAMRALQANFRQDLLVLSGTRGQLSAATAAFRVAREHIPPRDGERGHSINHSSLIYLLDAKARVAGYGYHTSTPQVLAETVKRLKKVKR